MRWVVGGDGGWYGGVVGCCYLVTVMVWCCVVV